MQTGQGRGRSGDLSRKSLTFSRNGTISTTDIIKRQPTRKHAPIVSLNTFWLKQDLAWEKQQLQGKVQPPSSRKS